jgi:hypothetical protein
MQWRRHFDAQLGMQKAKRFDPGGSGAKPSNPRNDLLKTIIGSAFSFG